MLEKVKTFDDVSRCQKWTTKWTDLGTTDLKTAERAMRTILESRPKGSRVSKDIGFRELMVEVRRRQLRDNAAYFKSDTYLDERLERRFGAMPLSAINLEMLEAWEDELREEELSDSTISKYTKALRSVFGTAKKTGVYSGPDPFDAYEIVAENKPRGVALSDIQQQELLSACFDPAVPLRSRQRHPRAIPPQLLRDIVEVDMVYGFRKGEIIGVNECTGKPGANGRMTYTKKAGLRVRDFDWVTNVLWVQRTKLRRRRTSGAVSKTRIDVVPQVAAILKRNIIGKGPDDLIFGHPDGRPLFGFQKAFDEAVGMAKLKLVDDEGNTVKKLQFRDLRVTAAQTLFSYGLDEHEVARILGHSSLQMVGRVYSRSLQGSQSLEVRRKIEHGLKARDRRLAYGAIQGGEKRLLDPDQDGMVMGY